MICKRCGNNVPEGTRFCPCCGNKFGAPLNSATMNNNTENELTQPADIARNRSKTSGSGGFSPVQPLKNMPQPYSPPSGNSGPPRQNGSNNLLVAVIVLISILIVGAVIILVLMLNDGSGNNRNERQNTSSESSEPVSETTVPVNEITNPDDETTNPVIETTNPVNETTNPGDETTNPDVDSSVPVNEPAAETVTSMKIPEGTYRFLQELPSVNSEAPEKYFISDIDDDDRYELIVLYGRDNYLFYRYNDDTNSYELAFKENASSGAALPEDPGFCNGRFCMRYCVRGYEGNQPVLGYLYYYLSGDTFVEGNSPASSDGFHQITMRSIDVDWTEDVVIPDAEVRPITIGYLERLMTAYGITDRESKIRFLDDRLTEILALHGYIFARYEDVDDNTKVPDGAVKNPNYVKYSNIGWYAKAYYSAYEPYINDKEDHQPGTYNKDHYYNGTTQYSNVSPASVVDNYNVILDYKKSL